jgi:hypothetical protein
MDLYSLQRLAKIEHEQRVRSLAPVSEYEYQDDERKSEKSYRPVLWARAILAALLHLITK